MVTVHVELTPRRSPLAKQVRTGERELALACFPFCLWVIFSPNSSSSEDFFMSLRVNCPHCGVFLVLNNPPPKPSTGPCLNCGQPVLVIPPHHSRSLKWAEPVDDRPKRGKTSRASWPAFAPQWIPAGPPPKRPLRRAPIVGGLSVTMTTATLMYYLVNLLTSCLSFLVGSARNPGDEPCPRLVGSRLCSSLWCSAATSRPRLPMIERSDTWSRCFSTTWL